MVKIWLYIEAKDNLTKIKLITYLLIRLFVTGHHILYSRDVYYSTGSILTNSSATENCVSFISKTGFKRYL